MLVLTAMEILAFELLDTCGRKKRETVTFQVSNEDKLMSIKQHDQFSLFEFSPPPFTGVTIVKYQTLNKIPYEKLGPCERLECVCSPVANKWLCCADHDLMLASHELFYLGQSNDALVSHRPYV